MNKFTSFCWMLAAILLASSGCKKKQPAASTDPAPDAPTAEAPPTAPADGAAAPKKLSGLDAVRTAIAQKQYKEAVGGIMVLQSSVTTPEQNVEVAQLKAKLKDELIMAAPTDQRAAEALALLRGMTLGR